MVLFGKESGLYGERDQMFRCQLSEILSLSQYLSRPQPRRAPHSHPTPLTQILTLPHTHFTVHTPQLPCFEYISWQCWQCNHSDNKWPSQPPPPVPPLFISVIIVFVCVLLFTFICFFCLFLCLLLCVFLCAFSCDVYGYKWPSLAAGNGPPTKTLCAICIVPYVWWLFYHFD